MDTKDASYEALHDAATDLMVEFSALARRVDALADKEGGEIIKLQERITKLQYKVDLMEPLTPGRLPSAEEFDSLARRVDDADDTLAEKIIELQNRVDKLETK